jgi:hypothetical protein
MRSAVQSRGRAQILRGALDAPSSRMATKSQQFKAEEQREHANRNAESERAHPDPTTNESERAGKKATYAFEETAGRRSRKSTRKSANRSKPDAGLNIREELRASSPQARHARETSRS